MCVCFPPPHPKIPTLWSILFISFSFISGPNFSVIFLTPSWVARVLLCPFLWDSSHFSYSGSILHQLTEQPLVLSHLPWRCGHFNNTTSPNPLARDIILALYVCTHQCLTFLLPRSSVVWLNWVLGCRFVSLKLPWLGFFSGFLSQQFCHYFKSYWFVLDFMMLAMICYI